MIQDEVEREVALSVLTEEIRVRMETPRSRYVDEEQAFEGARKTIAALRRE